MNTTNRVIDQTFPEVGIPIELENLSEELVPLAGDGERVRLFIRAPEESWRRLEPSDFLAWVDLEGLGPGLHQLEVQVEQAQPADRNVRILRRSPDQIAVRLDEIITRTVPVLVDVVDRSSVPYSYEVLTPTVNPPALSLRGPASTVEEVDAAVARVLLGEARETVTSEVEVELLDRRGEPLEGDRAADIRLESQTVQVVVPIQQRPGYRELIVSPVITGEPDRGHWLTNLRVNPQIISVVGLPAVTEGLPSIVRTEPIDVTGERAGTLTRNVRLELPENVSPLNQRSVTVTVEIEPLLSSRTVTVQPEITGLQPGLQAAQISPETLDVLVEGPIIELESLEPEDVIASLDLSGKVEGVSLVTPTIRTRGELVAESSLPAQIEVTLVEAQGVRTIDRPVVVGGIDPGLRANVTPPTVTVELVGPLLALQDIADEAIMPVLDISGEVTGTYVLTPTLNVPEGVTLTAISPPQLTVDLFSPDNTIVVTRTLSWDSLGGGLILNLQPKVVVMQLRGPGDEQTLAANPELRASVDLEGLEAGNYTLQPRVSLPGGYELVAVSPDAVTATLTPE